MIIRSDKQFLFKSFNDDVLQASRAIAKCIKTTCPIFLIGFIIIACSPEKSPAEHSQDTASIWKTNARQDITRAHSVVSNSHPGYVNTYDPKFKITADRTYQEALNRAESVASPDDYKQLIALYTAGFKDPHFAIFGNETLTDLSNKAGGEGQYWPGILTGLRAGKTKVLHSTIDDILVGSTVLSCDGRVPEIIIKDDILPWVLERADQPATWTRYTAELLIDRVERPRPRLNSCLFDQNDAKMEIVLEWSPIDETQLSSLIQQVQWGSAPDFSFSKTDNDILWISLPTFYPNDTQRTILENYISRLEKDRAPIQSSRAIVFDLRGNGGGSASWATRLIEALYGEMFFSSRRIEDRFVADWRVSEGNLNNLKASRKRIEAQNNADSLAWIDSVISGMKNSLDRNETYFREIGEPPNPLDKVMSDNPLNVPVFFLSDGRCASACLNFADILFQMGGVIHIGSDTYSDSAYLEARFVELPSGMSTLVMPTVVFRNRSRASGQYYTPDLYFPGDEWTTPALKKWVNGILDRQIEKQIEFNSTGERQ